MAVTQRPAAKQNQDTLLKHLTPHERAALAALVQIGGMAHAAQQAEAGVRHVVDHALGRQTQPVVYAAGGGRLAEVAAHRPVHQGADQGLVEAGLTDRLVGGLDALPARP